MLVKKMNCLHAYIAYIAYIQALNMLIHGFYVWRPNKYGVINASPAAQACIEAKNLTVIECTEGKDSIYSRGSFEKFS